MDEALRLRADFVALGLQRARLALDLESPAEALRWVDAGESFDIAILDWRMPGLTGGAVARQRRFRIARRAGRERGAGQARSASRTCAPVFVTDAGV